MSVCAWEGDAGGGGVDDGLGVGTGVVVYVGVLLRRFLTMDRAPCVSRPGPRRRGARWPWTCDYRACAPNIGIQVESPSPTALVRQARRRQMCLGRDKSGLFQVLWDIMSTLTKESDEKASEHLQSRPSARRNTRIWTYLAAWTESRNSSTGKTSRTSTSPPARRRMSAPTERPPFSA